MVNQVVASALSRLTAIVIEESARNSDFASKIQFVFAEPGSCISEDDTSNETSNIQRRRNRRDPAVLNPFDMIPNDETKLVECLRSLTEKELKDIIAQFGLDPTNRSMQWRKKERLIQSILEATRRKTAKGNAFRD